MAIDAAPNMECGEDEAYQPITYLDIVNDLAVH